MNKIMEGKAEIALDHDVFYNPKMSKLRDISVIFLKVAAIKKAKLLDATTASGVRAIRYAKECSARNITVLDINPKAAKNAKRNLKLNRIRAKVLNESVQEFTSSAEEAFEIIDVDPFGSPAPLIHDILKVCKDETILMITATDTATLCGAEGSACLRIYGAVPLHNELCQEVGIRILLNFISREAAQFNFGIEPMLSIADMHYMRVFLKLHRSSSQSVQSIKISGFGAYCNDCHNFSYKRGVIASVDNKCSYCKKKMQAFGPLWLGNLQNKEITNKMHKYAADYQPETQKLIERLDEELDLPLFFSIPKLTSYLRISSLPFDSILVSLNKKHQTSRTHFEKDSVKTTAGIEEIIRAIRAVRKSMH